MARMVQDVGVESRSPNGIRWHRSRTVAPTRVQIYSRQVVCFLWECLQVFDIP